MIELILGIIMAAYAFTRKTIINEPYKSRIDSFYNNANIAVNDILNNTTTEILLEFSRFCFKCIVICLILFMFSTLLPGSLPLIFTKFLSASFLIFFLIYFSITWILQYKKSTKNYFLNYPLVAILLAPSIIYLLDNYLMNQSGIKLFPLFEPIINLLNVKLLTFQIIWIISIFIILYIGPFAFAIPIFIALFTLVYLLRKMLLTLTIYVNTNIIDALLGLIFFLTPLIKYMLNNL